MSLKSNEKSCAGFTLVEMLVALVIFVLIGGVAFNLLVSAIAGQRAALTNQVAVDQISSAAEYMSRVIRQAKKDLVNLCLTSGTHLNYEISGGGQTLRLLDKEGFCREFSFDSASGAIRERKSADSTAAGLAASPIIPLTSDDIVIQGVWFFIQGASQTDTLQPRVTFFIDAQGLQLQTTISQRKFDVVE